MVKEGNFREDLFHRLNVIRLRLPPLRERKEDIPLLVPYFLSKSAKQLNVEPKGISKEAMDILAKFDFPGNVRQLENVCNWLTVMAPAQIITPADLPEDFNKEKEEAQSHDCRTQENTLVSDAQLPINGFDWTENLKIAVSQQLEAATPNLMKQLTETFEKIVLTTALAETKGKKVEAALKLGIGRNTMTRKIQEYNLE